MTKEDWATAILWAIAVVVLIGASIIGFRSTVENVTKIIVAVIGAVALVISAIVTHVLNQVRELQFEQQKQRQANYGELLRQLAGFVREARDGRDTLDTSRLYSWVVGSEEVIEATQQFVKEVSDINLRNLLVAMRQDVGLGSVKKELMPSLFPTKTVTGIPTAAKPSN